MVVFAELGVVNFLAGWCDQEMKTIAPGEVDDVVRIIGVWGEGEHDGRRENFRLIQRHDF
jgi:hypothetical protein